jgi:hypothetical protein
MELEDVAQRRRGAARFLTDDAAEVALVCEAGVGRKSCEVAFTAG